MRLLFLSTTQGNTNKEIIEQLKSWVNPDGKVAYFSSSPDSSRKYFTDVAKWFENSVGIKNTVYLDAHSSSKEIACLRNAGAIYLSGGNTYHLLQALRDTGAVEIIDKLARETDIPIIGVSAGGLCLTRDIRAASAENDNGVTDFVGLGLVNFGFYPHYKPEESCRIEINSFMKLTNTGEILAIPEYSGFAVTENSLTPLGEVLRFEKGSKNPETVLARGKEK